MLDSLDNCVVAVIGDLMLDCYLQGVVDRISPEAPVPVIRRQSERSLPGGAANVANNLAKLGVRVDVVGITGRDEARSTLVAALKDFGRVGIDGILVDDQRPTTQKLRIISGQQQIARVDIEDTSPLSEEVEAGLIAVAIAAVAEAQIVVLSDYGKGVLSDGVLRAVITSANQAGKKVLVDPRRKDWSAYRGASILTPNRRELCEATGMPCESDEEAAVAVARAREISGADILLTRSEKGMSFYGAGEPPIHVPAVALDVFDVSGAGDTVIAVFAAALAVGLDIRAALKMANHAAGIVVGKFGTATVTRDELLPVFNERSDSEPFNDGQLVGRDKAVALRRMWARQGLTVGVANGCFDLLHPGHVSLLRQAASACDRLIVALNSDASVARMKGPLRPVQDQTSRASVIGAIKGVSAVTVFDEDTPLDLLRVLQPDVLVKGADYAESEVIGADLVKARGGRVVLAVMVPGRSTTRLLDRSSRS